ncbi:MAG: DNA methyltransferase, partial [Myxococcota bacterium]
MAWLNRWAGRLWRLNRTFQGLLICAPVGHWESCLMSMVFSDGHPSRPGLRHLRLSAAPLRMDTVERLKRLAVQRVDGGATQLVRRLADELDLVHVTRSFYQRFKQARDRLAESWVGIEADALEDRRALSLLTLSRLLFVYFVQRKGLLDGRDDFMRRAVGAVMADPDRHLYRDLLRPLFFGLLNTPEGQRTQTAQRLGAVPYLNGGLFEPVEVEQAHPELDLPDGVLDEVFRELLERYTFTIREDGQGLGVDPEMLGRVFEGLMAADERGASGTFFTPRTLVETLVEQTLQVALKRMGLTDPQIMALWRAEPGVLSGSLTSERAREVLARLDDWAILDPACGSGAFLVGVLGHLERLHRQLAALGGVVLPDQLRRRLVCRNVYGIDINPAAVRLCELRLWLAILDEAPAGSPMEPLPNLDHRIRQGNTLLEPGDWISTPDDLNALHGLVQPIEALKSEYALASADQKTYTRAVLHEAEVDLFEALAQRHRTRLQDRCEQHRKALDSPDLFGERCSSGSKELVKALEALSEELAELDASVREMERDGRAPGFMPNVHFPEVMGRGGFDMIVGNPPWVRFHAVPPRQRIQLHKRYDVVKRATWTAGGMLKHLKGFGSQIDLSVCFVERSLQLLRPDGAMGLWLPSKLMRALYGGGVRRLLMTHAYPVSVSELDDRQFAGATTYPCAVVAVRGCPCPSPYQRVHVKAEAEERGRD